MPRGVRTCSIRDFPSGLCLELLQAFNAAHSNKLRARVLRVVKFLSFFVCSPARAAAVGPFSSVERWVREQAAKPTNHIGLVPFTVSVYQATESWPVMPKVTLYDRPQLTITTLTLYATNYS